MSHTQTFDGMWLCSLTRGQRERTCGYWYTVTTYGATPHTAFRSRDALLNWMAERGLSITQPIPQPGKWSCSRIVGAFNKTAHLDLADFNLLQGRDTRVMDNGNWTLGKITAAADGHVTIHYLNCNVKARPVFDYRTTDDQYCGPWSTPEVAAA